MNKDIIALIVTIIGVLSFAAVFIILYRSYSLAVMSEIRSGIRDVELIDEDIRSNKPSAIKKGKMSNIAKTVAFCLFIAIITPLFILALINKFQGNVTFLGEKGVMVVASGSMSEKHEKNTYLVERGLNNQIPTYQIILISTVQNASQLKKYDIIAYKNDVGVNIIHRIIDITYVDGQARFVTRGDFVESSDTYRPSINDVLGKYTGKSIGGVGIFVIFFQSFAGIATFIVLIACLLVIDRYSKLLQKTQSERLTLLGEAIDYLKEEDAKPFLSHIKQTLYYDGNAYVFDDKSLVEVSKAQPPQEEKETQTPPADTTQTQSANTTQTPPPDEMQSSKQTTDRGQIQSQETLTGKQTPQEAQENTKNEKTNKVIKLKQNKADAIKTAEGEQK